MHRLVNCSTAVPIPIRNEFTGKERDTESGNDDFGARYYANSMGRWLSPDWDESPVAIPYADLSNPQTLNLYTYLSNNPLNRTDPTGHAGNSGPIQLGGKTTMRVDTGGADQVNVHVFSKNGEYRGRLNPILRRSNGQRALLQRRLQRMLRSIVCLRENSPLRRQRKKCRCLAAATRLRKVRLADQS